MDLKVLKVHKDLKVLKTKDLKVLKTRKVSICYRSREVKKPSGCGKKIKINEK